MPFSWPTVFCFPEEFRATYPSFTFQKQWYTQTPGWIICQIVLTRHVPQLLGAGVLLWMILYRQHKYGICVAPSLAIYFNTAWLSVQNSEFSDGSCSSDWSILSTLTDNATAANSSCGIINCFNGATLVFPIMKDTWMLLCSSVILL